MELKESFTSFENTIFSKQKENTCESVVNLLNTCNTYWNDINEYNCTETKCNLNK